MSAFAVPELDRVQEAFPADALKWMPAWEDLPAKYRDMWGPMESLRIVNTWFYSGLADDVAFHPREGVDAEAAYRVVAATLRSFAPKHEHKIAACAYMIDQWFEKVEGWKKP